MVVSHDRYFLENVATKMVELNRAYADGFLRVKETTARFSKRKRISARATEEQEALANRVHTEIEWLRRGPKARTTKSKARIDKAHEMIGELADLNNADAEHDGEHRFFRYGRQTKQLVTWMV